MINNLINQKSFPECTKNKIWGSFQIFLKNLNIIYRLRKWPEPVKENCVGDVIYFFSKLIKIMKKQKCAIFDFFEDLLKFL